MKQDIFLEFIICPACKSDLYLVDSGLQCSSCDRVYMQIHSQITSLFTEPDKAIVIAYLGFHKAVEFFRTQELSLAKKIKESDRITELLPIIKALNENQAFFLKWRSVLTPFVNIPKLLDVVALPKYQRVGYGYNYSYLHLDWSGEAETEAHFLHIVKAVHEVSNHNADYIKGEVLLLGAGAGRLAVELFDSSRVIWAIDSSLGQVASFYELLEKDINYWEINTKNSRHNKDMLKKQTACIPDKLKETSKKVRYLWADAVNTPLKNASIHTIFSVFFSDVEPLRKLVNELKRILVSGGYFIHIGPLEFHFADMSQHYSYDSFVNFFRENNFKIVYESELTPLMPESKGLSVCRGYINMIMVAQFTGAINVDNKSCRHKS